MNDDNPYSELFALFVQERYPDGPPADPGPVRKYLRQFRAWLRKRAATDPAVARLKAQAEAEVAREWFEQALPQIIREGKAVSYTDVGPGNLLRQFFRSRKPRQEGGNP
jgi:hypothetical protein